MSSALEINYYNNFDSTLNGNFRSNLLYSGLAVHNRYGNFNWSAAFRYTYPSLLLKSQQVEGSYRPSFRDWQVMANYSFTPNDKLELLVINAVNKFDLTPHYWRGDFALSRDDKRSISGNYSGNKIYSFNVSLIGLKYLKTFIDSSSLSVAASAYFMNEKENNNLIGDYYYSPNAFNLEEDKEFLKSSFEIADNNLDMRAYEIKTTYNKKFSSNYLSAGASLRLTDLNGKINENYYEKGPEASQVIPVVNQSELRYKLNSISAYVQNKIILNDQWHLNIGLRLLHYYYNNETMVSPRAGITFYPSDKHTLKFMFGYYYQPPFFQELKNTNGQILKSQKAIHYVLGWDFQFKEHVKLLAEVYYKKLERLIPFNIDEVKIDYLTDKITDGYTFGFDLQVQGEFVEGAQSWVSYSYLDAKEKVNSEYKRRLLDQTHTLQLFLQDRFPKYPNWQAHVRLLVGSGYLFYPRIIATDANGQKYVTYSFDYRYDYAPYFRTDMGLSTDIDLGDDKRITITAEVLNVFNKQNNAGYTWIKAFKDSNKAVPIMQVISGRFFNIGVEFGF